MLSEVIASSKPRPGSFTSILEGLSGKLDGSAGGPERDALADDVVMLSYEQALQRHGRFQSNSPSDPEAGETTKAKRSDEGSRHAAEANRPLDPGEPASGKKSGPATEGKGTEASEARKAASITVRMSGAECAQVHARAAEAGMTVSAYVRSCVFEAESLRAQVKQALAELRAARTADWAASEQPSAYAEAGRGSARGWRTRLISRWTGKRSTQA